MGLYVGEAATAFGVDRTGLLATMSAGTVLTAGARMSGATSSAAPWIESTSTDGGRAPSAPVAAAPYAPPTIARRARPRGARPEATRARDASAPKLFDHVIPSSSGHDILKARLGSEGAATWLEGAVAAAASSRERSHSHARRRLGLRYTTHSARVMLSRLGRLANLGRSPFRITLFLDDDTVFCPSTDLRAFLAS